MRPITRGGSPLRCTCEARTLIRTLGSFYNVAEDFSETNDLATRDPGRLREMIERWWSEAGRYNVLPLDDRGVIRSLEQPALNRPREVVTYYPGMPSVPGSNMLNFRGRSYTIMERIRFFAWFRRRRALE